MSTALLGDWVNPLYETNMLQTPSASFLRAEARAIHRQLVPVWRRRTKHGRVLSLDLPLGDGLCLYDLVADKPEPMASTVIEDERLTALLHALTLQERQTVVARATADGTTWTEAAQIVGVDDPKSFGERVRRKVKRLIDEQQRRRAQAAVVNKAGAR